MVRGHLTIRPARTEDLRNVDALIELGFESGGPSLATAGAPPAGELRYVAAYDGDVVGYGAARSYGVAAYVGPLVVDASARRRGIASDLLRTLATSLDEMGARSLLLDATERNAPLYERFGFTKIDATDVYERRVDAAITPSAKAVDDRSFASALDIDRRITGCDRAATLRHFADHASAWLALAACGYLLARGRVLGPWLAEDPTTAAVLLGSALDARPASNVAYVPRSNVAARAILRDRGFALDRSLCHLGYGTASPMRRERIYGQASLGHG